MFLRRFSLIPVLTLATATLLSACGSSNSVNATAGTSGSEMTEQAESIKATEPVKPLDLTGLWVQEDSEDSYMAATIQDDTVAVFLVLEDDDTPWTYWIGTYDAPTDDIDTYNWISKSTFDGSGLFASTADTKNFAYTDGKLQCEVQLQGETFNVNFIRGDWDTSKIPDSAFSSVNSSTTTVFPIEIKDQQWIVNDYGYLYCYVTLFNPNTDIAVEYPSVRITARDASNVLLGTYDQTCSIVYPQQEMTYGFQAFSVEENPTTVDIEMLDVEDYDLKKVDPSAHNPMEAVNVAIRSDKVVGEISNANDTEYDMAAVTVLMKNDNGDLVGILTSFVDKISPNSTTPFEISIYGCSGATNCDVYVCEW